jgi:hypothetical protein
MAGKIDRRPPPPPPPPPSKPDQTKPDQAKPDGANGTSPKDGPASAQEGAETAFMEFMVSAKRGQKSMYDLMEGMQKKAADKLKEDQKETIEEMDS